MKLNFLHRIGSVTRNFYYALTKFLNSATEHNIYMLASGIAFTIITSIIPTVLLFLFALGYLLDSDQIVEQINIYAKDFFVIGYRQDIIEKVKEQINVIVNNRGLTGLIGIGGLLWTSSALAAAIRTALNKVFDLKSEKNFFINKLFDILVITVMGILTYVSVLLGPLYSLIFSMSEKLNRWAMFSIVDDILAEVIVILGALLVFFSIFRFMPYKKLNNRTVLSGTLFCAILWELSRKGFEFYVHSFKSFSKVYGTYAIFAASAIWIYFTALVFMFGAELALYFSKGNFLQITDSAAAEEEKTKTYRNKKMQIKSHQSEKNL